ncbi:RNA polymerase sigma-70 factor [Dyadobacter sp. LHD-138]|uniref:RNA polymerase sigma-70 factor n=1 Tax=Dyadobacter sp. LHD-138 TaxID=3071413 RepID=UPI0027E1420D|nr:RNA polymerase sigma-70 factor [Dyadobacter sp. LHD-138]MDQ6481090.1 RNA polymerase sigma-70 factor [Dyadobacter sp. LHD-138]
MHFIEKQYLADHELTAHFFKNDEKAFNEIYNRYWQRLYVFALSKLDDEANAEEVIQNVFIDLWQKGKTDQIENLSAYLYRAVKNKCIDQIRQRLVRGRYEEIVLQTRDEEDPGTEELLAFQELKAVLNMAMNSLPEKTREIFRLSRMEYLSVREVSVALSIPERTVEYHLAQALKMMRVYLRDFIVLLVLFQSQLVLDFKYEFFVNNL